MNAVASTPRLAAEYALERCLYRYRSVFRHWLGVPRIDVPDSLLVQRGKTAGSRSARWYRELNRQLDAALLEKLTAFAVAREITSGRELIAALETEYARHHYGDARAERVADDYAYCEFGPKWQREWQEWLAEKLSPGSTARAA